MKKLLLFSPLIFVSLWLRLVNLGYSNYQGDEIKALCRPEAGQSLIEFLLGQRKGPVQFLISCSLENLNISPDNELVYRLPFAVAGIFSIYFFYKFIRLQLDGRVAYYASFFMATNGLFIAFSRIVQYQSIVILFSILALYLLSLAVTDKSWRIYGLYGGMASWAIAILAHYDGVFVAPMAFYLLYKYYRKNLTSNRSIKHIFGSAAFFLLILSLFYVPFILFLSQNQIAYLTGRITQKAAVSSAYMFKVYNPDPIFYIYALLALISLYKVNKIWPFLIWFIFPFIAMELLIGKPKTHIYTYIYPLFILMAYGLRHLELTLKLSFSRKVNQGYTIFFSICLLLFFLVPNTLFVSHQREYPWENERFLLWNYEKTSIAGLFGFPYYRAWEKIGDFIKENNNRGYYLSNDSTEIARFYLPSSYVPLEKELNFENSRENIYIIYVKNSQRARSKILGRENSYWETKQDPTAVFSNGDDTLAKVYKITPDQLLDIQINNP